MLLNVMGKNLMCKIVETSIPPAFDISMLMVSEQCLLVGKYEFCHESARVTCHSIIQVYYLNRPKLIFTPSGFFRTRRICRGSSLQLQLPHSFTSTIFYLASSAHKYHLASLFHRLRDQSKVNRIYFATLLV